MSDRLSKGLVSGSAIAVGAFVCAPAADAANFEVTNLTDSDPGSLRDAIDDANAAVGADTVTFASGVTGSITLTSGPLLVTDALTITGPGANQLSVSGDDAYPVFFVVLNRTPGDVSISGLEATEGISPFGGAIFNANSNLTLTAMALTDSTAKYIGGGLASFGDATVVRSTISGNEVVGGDSKYDGPIAGGGINAQGDLNLINSTVSGNGAPVGGGLFACGCDYAVDVRSSTIAENDALYGGGVAFYNYEPSQESGEPGVAVAAPGELAFESSIVANNTAGEVGPDVYDAGFGGMTAGFSLVEDTSGATLAPSPGQNIFGVDPALGPLGNSGGQTDTHLPNPGSPVLDKGLSPGLGTDQRGLTRVADDPSIANAPGGDGSDIGSVERDAPAQGVGPIVSEKQSGRFCLGQKATIVGTTGNDKIVGTPGADVIRGMRGNDRISGLDGNDVICGDKGRDTIKSGSGNDEVKGGNDSDKIRGGTGNDLLRGGSAVDRILGQDGDDQMFGGAKNGVFKPGSEEAGGRKTVGNRCDGGAGTDSADGCETVLNVP